MEQELLSLLDQTLQPADGPRRAAEAQLQSLHSNDAFPIALSNVASAPQVPLNSRQAALTSLRRYVNKCWSPTFEEFEGPVTNLEVKTHLKPRLLELVTADQRQVRTIAAAIVGKIATSDYPDEWPELLPSLLSLIRDGNDAQSNGALHVLNDVLDEGLGDDLFFHLAKQIVELLYKAATDERRSFTVRAQAVCTFKCCLDTLGMMKSHDHSEEVITFAQEAIGHWIPFITSIMEAPLTSSPDVKGLMSLKIQAIKTVMQSRMHFHSLFDPYLEKLFAATWSDMGAVRDRYVHEFVDDDAEGRMVDADNLPYSLDLYVLEQLDFIQSCLGHPNVRVQIEQAGFAGASNSPFSQMLAATIALSQISGEDKNMWLIDLNVFLSEETAVSANYTPRTASADLVLKLGEHFPEPTMQSLFDHTQTIFQSGQGAFVKEASLHLWDQLLNEYAENGQNINPELAANLLQLIVAAMTDPAEQFLRARGYATAATLTKAAYDAIRDRVPELMEQSIKASTTDGSDVVEIAALRSFQKYANVISEEQMKPFQSGIISAVRTFLENKSDDDPEDSQDVLGELVETIQSTVANNFTAVLDPTLRIPELLFSIANSGVENPHLLGLVRDCFESIIRRLINVGSESTFVPLCEKLLPLLITMLALDVSKNEHPLIQLGTEVLNILAEHGTSPLPQGFVATVMPHLTRILVESNEVDVVQAACSALTQIIQHDCAQLLEWRDASGKSGLEIALIIIDRLLRPQFSEDAAMEVGGLAAEIVDKAGDQLGALLPELLRAIATRLATAKLLPFVQSLCLVFARLVLKTPKDVVDFLAGLAMEDRSGLEVVMSTWLGHSINFMGYTEITLNIMALCQLYNLEDPRLAQIMVQGDLIVPQSSRIMTRSRAKQNPDQYTSVSVPMKIVKLLIQELAPSVAGTEGRGYYTGGGQAVDEAASDDGWEDVPEGLNIPGISREELLALGASGRTSRTVDDEAYVVLSNFFKSASSRNTGDFRNLCQGLNEEEQHTLSQLR